MPDFPTYSIPFTNDASFTYSDEDKIEVSGGVLRLVDRKPANATLWSTFTSATTASWAAGSPTATETGSPTIASGELDLRGGTLKYISYAAASNAAFTTTGAIRFRYRPNYTGSPAAARGLVSLVGTGLQNMIQLNHLSDGNIELSIFNSSGIAIVNGSIGAWSPTAGTQYEFLIVVDVLNGAGASKVFIDGAQHGSTQAGTGARVAATTLLFGTNYNATYSPDGRYDDLVVYSVAPYTAAYTAGYTLSDTRYATDNPWALWSAGFELDGLEGFTATEVKSGSDQIKYELNLSGTDKWFNGSAWATAATTYATANTAAEVESNKASLDLDAGFTLKPRVFLHSDDGYTTPTISLLEILFDFFDTPTVPDRCQVFTNIREFLADEVDGTVHDATITVEQPREFFYDENLQLPWKNTYDFDSNGQWDLFMVETETPGSYYNFTINYTDASGKARTVSLKKRIVPADTVSAALSALEVDA